LRLLRLSGDASLLRMLNDVSQTILEESIADLMQFELGQVALAHLGGGLLFGVSSVPKWTMLMG
jgi:hypothetical protein